MENQAKENLKATYKSVSEKDSPEADDLTRLPQSRDEAPFTAYGTYTYAD